MKEELARLQGTWDIVTLEVDGATQPGSALRGAQIVVHGDRFTTSGMGATYKGKLKVGAGKAPRTLDLIFEEGPEKGNRSLAIYELDGDTWRICLTVTGKKRPTAFATTPGSGLALETLRRRTGSGTVDPLREELARLEGEWSMVSCEMDGQQLPRAMTKTGKRIVQGNEMIVTVGGEVYMKAAYALGPSNRPKTIDYILTAGAHMGETQYGIYEIDGDTLRTCFAAPARSRPSDFQADAGRTLTVWKRLKT